MDASTGPVSAYDAAARRAQGALQLGCAGAVLAAPARADEGGQAGASSPAPRAVQEAAAGAPDVTFGSTDSLPQFALLSSLLLLLFWVSNWVVPGFIIRDAVSRAEREGAADAADPLQALERPSAARGNSRDSTESREGEPPGGKAATHKMGRARGFGNRPR